MNGGVEQWSNNRGDSSEGPSGVAKEEWVGPDPHCVQAPPEISANLLKRFFIYRVYPMYVYCNFYCSPAKKNGLDPPLFLGWRRH